jgi:D-alanyl-D-alanine carboxypeptidase/D-alanyl-D-alanine-endopeptidase (penicillin-binding protein 4)
MGYGSASLKSNYAVGSWVTGSQAAKSFLKDTLNVPVENLVIDDGGGLSKTNRITTDILAKILLYAQKQPWGADYLKTLAVAGVDGTLKKRMKRTSAAGRVSAKTGYIAGISSLSGYVADSHGHPKIIFSMIFQFPSGKLWQAKSAEDKLCIRLAEYLGSVREQMPQNTIEPESYSKSSEEPDEE